MLTGLHLLLTYRCTHACDHCFVFGSPDARGTFTVDQIGAALAQAREIGTVEWIYFEGGEPFLLYPLLLEGLRRARALGFRTGVVTNAYWAESEQDARLWLEPLKALGVEDLSVSDDTLHESTGAGHALAAARALGIPACAMSLPTPGEGDGVRFRGRASDRLADAAPRHPAGDFTTCPYENLVAPERVHLDALGNVHLCQGLLLGNAWRTPLAALLDRYDPSAHPIVGPLVVGGPAALAGVEGRLLERREGWADACHLCFAARRGLRARNPDLLGPDAVYDEPG